MRAAWSLALTAVVSACAADGEPQRPVNSSPGAPQLADAAIPGTRAGADAASASPTDAGAISSADLPCAVASLLRSRCQVCHTQPPRGAPMPLVTRADLLAPGLSNANRRVVDLVLANLESREMPPPPLPAATADEVAALRAWIAAGTPEATCTSNLPDAGADAGPSPYDTPVRCSSGKYWEEDDGTGDKMRPGRACISCHLMEAAAPDWTIAGTVYPSAHEPDHCHGADDSDIEVVITGADGRELRLEVNSVGNFHTQERVAFPIRAKIVMDGRERHMGPAQSTGDCNSCHTQQGANGAPGRIMQP